MVSKTIIFVLAATCILAATVADPIPGGYGKGHGGGGYGKGYGGGGYGKGHGGGGYGKGHGGGGYGHGGGGYGKGHGGGGYGHGGATVEYKTRARSLRVTFLSSPPRRRSETEDAMVSKTIIFVLAATCILAATVADPTPGGYGKGHGGGGYGKGHGGGGYGKGHGGGGYGHGGGGYGKGHGGGGYGKGQSGGGYGHGGGGYGKGHGGGGYATVEYKTRARSLRVTFLSSPPRRRSETEDAMVSKTIIFVLAATCILAATVADPTPGGYGKGHGGGGYGHGGGGYGHGGGGYGKGHGGGGYETIIDLIRHYLEHDEAAASRSYF
ncbi:glycine-rich cell wall structural protein 1.8-like [Penaeus japonicus]|uniref:glycine-rich cell wall structural protein 1.8-like n=1 Tax=Penaeus japonicus TaxID=27405 RepID=UPI001C712AEA|nr:glycine-rich cell wall structural protein 1.8-like [Penaeus japonicus]